VTTGPDSLEPITRGLYDAFMRACEIRGLPVKGTQFRRTMDEQGHLWAIGRTHENGVWVKVGSTVTNAKPGESAHNYGMAFDIAFRGKTLEECYPPKDDPRWLEVGVIGENLGLSWGGPLGDGDRFTWDRPHFERPDWKVAAGRFA
jgi:peptidoglycan L-alanyl-D-glutamate endopeptidase CwlK